MSWVWRIGVGRVNELLHRSLPHIYEQFEEHSRRYLVMEFIQGVTLEQYWENCRKQGKPIPIEHILDIGIQLCEVLDYLHMQQPPILFRDLKPDNSMLTVQGKVYLIDFGIARLLKPGQQKDTVALGSPGYAAPEQYRQATSPRSDIYSLGAMLHHLLTGDDLAETPFHFKPFSLNHPMLEDLVMSMVETDEMLRPATMKRVQKMLQRIVQELPSNSIQGVNQQAVQGMGMVAAVDKMLSEAMLRSIRAESDPLPLSYPSDSSEKPTLVTPLQLAPSNERHRESSFLLFTPSSQEAHLEAEYRKRREQEKQESNAEYSWRMELYKAKKHEWSNPEDIDKMAEASQDENADETPEEMEIRVINKDDASEEDRQERSLPRFTIAD